MFIVSISQILIPCLNDMDEENNYGEKQNNQTINEVVL